VQMSSRPGWRIPRTASPNLPFGSSARLRIESKDRQRKTGCRAEHAGWTKKLGRSISHQSNGSQNWNCSIPSGDDTTGGKPGTRAHTRSSGDPIHTTGAILKRGRSAGVHNLKPGRWVRRSCCRYLPLEARIRVAHKCAVILHRERSTLPKKGVSRHRRNGALDPVNGPAVRSRKSWKVHLERGG
jgi:hypothetical protein